MEQLSLPTPPKSCVFRLIPNSLVHVSKGNNASKVCDHEGAHREFALELTNVRKGDALALDAFLAKHPGQMGKFVIQDFQSGKSPALERTCYNPNLSFVSLTLALKTSH
ncbi:hypothetical protein [Pseudoalteromonas rubra]|uniref:Uncharacterized protein n=1 Tax=Pseudoalteromonas rubra TaxID=43658 RepID=A0A5S3X4M0_9GAMM|nr:hypothetical protein [Pseudoalteromonas rubra]TMP39350.1 hypothetical protein CWB98_01815 [Pseudoalteromonas rubra]